MRHRVNPVVALIAPLITAGLIRAEPTTQPASQPASQPAAAIGPEQALRRLQQGNAAYVSGQPAHLRADAARRLETVKDGQHPFATIVACSDSREPVELLFDQGIGDLFVVRVAGNVCDTDEIGSIEYGAGHLHTPLLVVLGHTQCGAVTAVATHAEVHGSIPALVDNIIPAVEAAAKANPGLKGKALIPAAIRANVLQSMQDVLQGSEEVRELVKNGTLAVRGAVYDLETGRVEWLGPHPQEASLLSAAEKHATEPQKTHHAEGTTTPQNIRIQPNTLHSASVQESSPPRLRHRHPWRNPPRSTSLNP